MYFVYIIQNVKGKRCIGSCEILERRLREHNHNYVSSTKNKGPFKLIYREGFTIRTEARKRENQLKSFKGNNKLKQLIKDSTPSSSLV